MVILLSILIVMGGVILPPFILTSIYYPITLLLITGCVFQQELFKQKISWDQVTGSIFLVLGLSIYYLTLLLGVGDFAPTLFTVIVTFKTPRS